MKERLRNTLHQLKRKLPVSIPLFSKSAWRAAYRMAQLVVIVETLRGPQGCPWDKKQSLRTILPDLREEALEAVVAGQQAIDGQPASFQEELGDVLFLVTFLSHLCEEQEYFDLADALHSICAKLLRRHPHVFESAGPIEQDQIQRNWARIKAQEKQHTHTPADKAPSILEGIPPILPALHLTQRISQKVAQVGFDWPNPQAVFDKVLEEVRELQEAIEEDDPRAQEEEFGDLMFTLVNLARHLKFDGENALLRACQKFKSRFQYVEAQLHAQERSVHESSLAQLEALWQDAKKHSQKEESSPSTC